jgi:hypothetical protein
LRIMKTTKAQATSKQKKTSETGKAVETKKVTSGPSEKEIRDKAREIYLERIARGEHGTSADDWHKAEKLLKGLKK